MRTIKVLLFDLKYIIKNNIKVCTIFVLFSCISMMCIFGVMSKYKDSAVYIKSIEKYKYCYNIPVIKEEDSIETILKDDSLNLPKVKKIMQVDEAEEIMFYDCYFERELSESELKSLNKKLPISVYWTYETYKAQADSHMFIIVVVLFLFLLVIFNLLNFYTFLIKKNSYRFILYRICGATAKLVCLGTMLIPMVITAIAYLLAVVLYIFVLYPFLHSLDSSMLLMNWDVYVISFLAVELYTIVMNLPQVVKLCHKRRILQA